MDSNLKKLILIFSAFFIFGGVGAITALCDGIVEGFKMFFPLFFDIAKMELEDYLTSPYFITGVIMTIASAFGIWFGSKKGKILYSIVSIVCALASLASIFMNVV